MKARLWGFGVFGFWAIMMIALVRIEYSTRQAPWDEVPLPQVFQRILNNTDPQWLNIYQQNQLAGFLRFDVTNHVAFYRIDGNLSLQTEIGATPLRLRVTGKGEVNPQLAFQQFELQGNTAGLKFEARSVPGSQKILVQYDLGAGPQQREFDPHAGAAMATALGMPDTGGAETKAYRGRLNIEREVQRVYIIETKLSELAWARVYVDEAGMIVQAETSAGWRLRSAMLDEQANRPTPKVRP